jgi:hypothetical protein
MNLPNANSSGLSGVLTNSHSHHPHATTTSSYGSLRESNQRGTFLDGPSSYRDSRTGDIRQLRVRFQQQQQQLSNNTEHQQQHDDSIRDEGLSIRDRMKLARARQTTPGAVSNHSPQKPTSSLAAMFDDDDAAQRKSNTVASSLPTSHFISHMLAVADHTTHGLSSGTFYNTDRFSDRPSGALSTSLTGLEILQRGGLPTRSLATIQDDGPDELPRTTLGHNALLSRSLSEPLGGRRATPPGLIPPLHLSGGSSPAAAPPTSFLSAAMQQQQQQPPPFSQATNLLSSEVAELRLTDPDVEGAFEMDME